MTNPALAAMSTDELNDHYLELLTSTNQMALELLRHTETNIRYKDEVIASLATQQDEESLRYIKENICVSPNCSAEWRTLFFVFSGELTILGRCGLATEERAYSDRMFDLEIRDLDNEAAWLDNQ